MSHSVFCSKLIPSECRTLMHRIDNPSCVILSGLYSPVIYSEIRSEFKRCLYDVASVSYVAVDAIPYPEIRLNLSRFLEESIKIYFFVPHIKNIEFLFLY